MRLDGNPNPKRGEVISVHVEAAENVAGYRVLLQQTDNGNLVADAWIDADLAGEDRRVYISTGNCTPRKSYNVLVIYIGKPGFVNDDVSAGAITVYESEEEGYFYVEPDYAAKGDEMAFSVYFPGAARIEVTYGDDGPVIAEADGETLSGFCDIWEGENPLRAIGYNANGDEIQNDERTIYGGTFGGIEAPEINVPPSIGVDEDFSLTVSELPPVGWWEIRVFPDREEPGEDDPMWNPDRVRNLAQYYDNEARAYKFTVPASTYFQKNTFYRATVQISAPKYETHWEERSFFVAGENPENKTVELDTDREEIASNEDFNFLIHAPDAQEIWVKNDGGEWEKINCELDENGYGSFGWQLDAGQYVFVAKAIYEDNEEAYSTAKVVDVWCEDRIDAGEVEIVRDGDDDPQGEPTVAQGTPLLVRFTNVENLRGAHFAFIHNNGDEEWYDRGEHRCLADVMEVELSTADLEPGSYRLNTDYFAVEGYGNNYDFEELDFTVTAPSGSVEPGEIWLNVTPTRGYRYQNMVITAQLAGAQSYDVYYTEKGADEPVRSRIGIEADGSGRIVFNEFEFLASTVSDEDWTYVDRNQYVYVVAHTTEDQEVESAHIEVHCNKPHTFNEEDFGISVPEIVYAHNGKCVQDAVITLDESQLPEYWSVEVYKEDAEGNPIEERRIAEWNSDANRGEHTFIVPKDDLEAGKTYRVNFWFDQHDYIPCATAREFTVRPLDTDNRVTAGHKDSAGNSTMTLTVNTPYRFFVSAPDALAVRVKTFQDSGEPYLDYLGLDEISYFESDGWGMPQSGEWTMTIATCFDEVDVDRAYNDKEYAESRCWVEDQWTGTITVVKGSDADQIGEAAWEVTSPTLTDGAGTIALGDYVVATLRMPVNARYYRIMLKGKGETDAYDQEVASSYYSDREQAQLSVSTVNCVVGNDYKIVAQYIGDQGADTVERVLGTITVTNVEGGADETGWLVFNVTPAATEDGKIVVPEGDIIRIGAIHEEADFYQVWYGDYLNYEGEGPIDTEQDAWDGTHVMRVIAFENGREIAGRELTITGTVDGQCPKPEISLSATKVKKSEGLTLTVTGAPDGNDDWWELRICDLDENEIIGWGRDRGNDPAIDPDGRRTVEITPEDMDGMEEGQRYRVTIGVDKIGRSYNEASASFLVVPEEEEEQHDDILLERIGEGTILSNESFRLHVHAPGAKIICLFDGTDGRYRNAWRPDVNGNLYFNYDVDKGVHNLVAYACYESDRIYEDMEEWELQDLNWSNASNVLSVTAGGEELGVTDVTIPRSVERGDTAQIQLILADTANVANIRTVYIDAHNDEDWFSIGEFAPDAQGVISMPTSLLDCGEYFLNIHCSGKVGYGNASFNDRLFGISQAPSQEGMQFTISPAPADDGKVHVTVHQMINVTAYLAGATNYKVFCGNEEQDNIEIRNGAMKWQTDAGTGAYEIYVVAYNRYGMKIAQSDPVTVACEDAVKMELPDIVIPGTIREGEEVTFTVSDLPDWWWEINLYNRTYDYDMYYWNENGQGADTPVWDADENVWKFTVPEMFNEEYTFEKGEDYEFRFWFDCADKEGVDYRYPFTVLPSGDSTHTVTLNLSPDTGVKCNEPLTLNIEAEGATLIAVCEDGNWVYRREFEPENGQLTIKDTFSAETVGTHNYYVKACYDQFSWDDWNGDWEAFNWEAFSEVKTLNVTGEAVVPGAVTLESDSVARGAMLRGTIGNADNVNLFYVGVRTVDDQEDTWFDPIEPTEGATTPFALQTAELQPGRYKLQVSYRGIPGYATSDPQEIFFTVTNPGMELVFSASPLTGIVGDEISISAYHPLARYYEVYYAGDEPWATCETGDGSLRYTMEISKFGARELYVKAYDGNDDLIVESDHVTVTGLSESGLLGDVDDSGDVTKEDARLVLRKIVGLEDESPDLQWVRAHMNNDGEITTKDVVLILIEAEAAANP